MTITTTTERERLLDAIDLAFLANGGREWSKLNCECEPEVNAAPCRYCAIHKALTQAKSYAASRYENLPVPREALDDYAHTHSGDPDTFPELRDDPCAVEEAALQFRVRAGMEAWHRDFIATLRDCCTPLKPSDLR